MKFKNKSKPVFILLFIALLMFSTTRVQAQTDKELFDRARLALFDRQWDKAIEQLNQLTQLFPTSPYYSQALFFKGKCYEEKKLPAQALEYYTTFLKISQNETLKEEAIVSIIDLNFQVYEKGQKQALLEIINYLQNPERSVRYYAAFKLSYARDKTAASRAVPVLKRLISEESDNELVDRAKIALMRINPIYLEKTEDQNSGGVRSLSIEVYSKEDKKVTFRLTIPFMLANVALDALPNEQKKQLHQKGYNLDKILNDVLKKGQIVRVDTEDAIVKIWLE